MKRTKIKLDELTCPSCITNIENTLAKKEGIEEARVLFNSSQVKVSYRDDAISENEIIQVIEKLGYPVKKEKTTI